jgi:hypothetical protein
VNFLKFRSFWQATFWLSSATLAISYISVYLLRPWQSSASLSFATLHANLSPLWQSSANHLTPFCKSSAAILSIFCRHSANHLPPSWRCSSMLPILSRSSNLMLFFQMCVNLLNFWQSFASLSIFCHPGNLLPPHTANLLLPSCRAFASLLILSSYGVCCIVRLGIRQNEDV